MISKNEIKLVRSLARKKFRDQTSLFVAEGEKIVSEAVESGFEVKSIWHIEDIGREVMERITFLSSPSPVLALIKQRPAAGKQQIEALIKSRPLVLALDSLRDPGNVGTIIRLADWFGIDAILASYDTVDIYNPKVVQATMGAIFRVDFIYCDLPQTLSLFRDSGMDCYGTFLEGDTIYDSPLSREGVIVMGSESDGISAGTAAKISRKLFIPPFPPGERSSESLNVAIATAITCAEFRRRHNIQLK